MVNEEILITLKYFKLKIDSIRSLGVIFYEMCTNKLPFRDDHEILTKQTPKLPKLYEDINPLLEGYIFISCLIIHGYLLF